MTHAHSTIVLVVVATIGWPVGTHTGSVGNTADGCHRLWLHFTGGADRITCRRYRRWHRGGAEHGPG